MVCLMLLFICMKASPKKLLPLTLIGIAVTSLFSVQPAQAYTITLEQVGLNVVATGSGAINLTGLNFAGIGIAPLAFIDPSSGLIVIGRNSFGGVDNYTGLSGPSSFGNGGKFFPLNIPPIAPSGDLLGLDRPTHFGTLTLSVPFGYVSGAPLSSSMIFDFRDTLRTKPGTYVWTWGTGLPNQNFTLIIPPGVGVPDGGSTVSLLGCALLGLAALRRKLGC
jgi:hypothetical protein